MSEALVLNSENQLAEIDLEYFRRIKGGENEGETETESPKQWPEDLSEQSLHLLQLLPPYNSWAMVPRGPTDPTTCPS
jgi:hypothetical protein